MTISFYDWLGVETASAQAEFRTIPVIARTLAEGVERGLYLDFLGSAYHHVRYTCPLLGLALSRCEREDGAFRAGLLDYLEEEKGHEDWILEDIAALGGDRQRVETGPSPFPVRMMIAYATYAIEHLSPYALLGMVFVLEGSSVALARAAAGAIEQRVGSGEGGAGSGFRYLTSHGHLDESHLDHLARLLDKIDRPDRRILIAQAAQDFFRLYGDIFRALGSSPVAAQESSHVA